MCHGDQHPIITAIAMQDKHRLSVICATVTFGDSQAISSMCSHSVIDSSLEIYKVNTGGGSF